MTATKNNTPVYVTPFAKLQITAKNPALRSWMVRSIALGKADGQAPLGEVTVTGGTLNVWTDYAEVVLPTVLGIEKIARGTEAFVDLQVVVKDGKIMVLHNGKALPLLDMKLKTPVRNNLAGLAEVLLPLLGINGSTATAMLANAKKETTKKEAKAPKPRFPYSVNPETMTLTGVAQLPGSVRCDVVTLGDEDLRGEVVASAAADGDGKMNIEFKAVWNVTYLVVFFDKENEIGSKSIKPDPNFVPARDRKTTSATAEFKHTSFEVELKSEGGMVNKKWIVRGSSKCPKALSWDIKPEGLKTPVQKGDGDTAMVEFEAKKKDYVLTFYGEKDATHEVHFSFGDDLKAVIVEPATAE